MDTLIAILQLVIVISALIIIHEIGHFVAMRIFKVEVEEFGLGFPPKARTLFTWRGVEYTLNWLPFGGFVRPKGENDPTIPGGLANANPWVRIAVYAAGPLMNLLVGVILYALMFSQVGKPIYDQVIVMQVAENSPAAEAGLLEGDLITYLNETTIDSSTILRENIYANLGKEIDLTLVRDDQRIETSLTPRTLDQIPKNEGSIGIIMGNPSTPINVIQALPQGVIATANHSYLLVTLPAQIIKGAIEPSDARLVGYKGMYDIYQDRRVAEQPIPDTDINLNVIGFFTTITISLGILNLFPIPALDGGRILFILPELIFRKRIPPHLENWINVISFMALIAIFLYINVLDFTNPVQLP